MKRILSLFFVALATFALTACGGGRDLASRLDELENATSFTATVTTEMPFFGEMEITMKVDGDVGFATSSMFGMASESYMIIEDDQYVSYTRTVGETQWTREVVNEHDLGMTEITEELDASWFTYDDGVYVLDEAYFDELMGEDADTLKAFTIELGDDSITITMTMGEMGMDMDMTMVFTAINSTTIELPDFSDHISYDPGGNGETIPGAVPYLNDTLESGETNTHTIVIDTAGTYAIYTESNFDTVGSISQDGVLLAEDDDSGLSWNFKITIYLEPGEYEVDVWGWMSDYGPYELFVELLD